jgi:hypothetical protein
LDLTFAYELGTKRGANVKSTPLAELEINYPELVVLRFARSTSAAPAIRPVKMENRDAVFAHDLS